ncbi:iron export ABC transporter permease subunit FetB [Bacillota bacterium LX-D]|nr:iron export ABC transporter permease subunit FetB [Bacillota bacterium LX-D]
MQLSSLLIASLLITLSLLFSYSQKLKLEKDIIVGVIRAIVQLAIVGYILNIIFGLKSPYFTTFFILTMLYNAALNAAKRGKDISGAFGISFISIGIGAFITLAVLLLADSIHYIPNEIIPISGMIISNAMAAIGLCYRQLSADFKNKHTEIETKLSLGAEPFLSAQNIIQDSIKTGMQPTIDSMRTLGIVSLPGMMTGLILAGTPPLEAIKYQILVTFMMLSCTSVASFTVCYLSYRKFFTSRKQLLLPN